MEWDNTSRVPRGLGRTRDARSPPAAHHASPAGAPPHLQRRQPLLQRPIGGLQPAGRRVGPRQLRLQPRHALPQLRLFSLVLSTGSGGGGGGFWVPARPAARYCLAPLAPPLLTTAAERAALLLGPPRCLGRVGLQLRHALRCLLVLRLQLLVRRVQLLRAGRPGLQHRQPLQRLCMRRAQLLVRPLQRDHAQELPLRRRQPRGRGLELPPARGVGGPQVSHLPLQRADARLRICQRLGRRRARAGRICVCGRRRGRLHGPVGHSTLLLLQPRLAPQPLHLRLLLAQARHQPPHARLQPHRQVAAAGGQRRRCHRGRPPLLAPLASPALALGAAVQNTAQGRVLFLLLVLLGAVRRFIQLQQKGLQPLYLRAPLVHLLPQLPHLALQRRERRGGGGGAGGGKQRALRARARRAG